jgi:hypothetical protein
LLAKGSGVAVQVSRRNDGEVVVLLEGDFDPAAALRLRGALVEVGAGEHVVLDFNRVRVLPDLALAWVARELGATSARVELRGLGLHQTRMLRYLGFAGEPVADADDARG